MLPPLQTRRPQCGIGTVFSSEGRLAVWLRVCRVKWPPKCLEIARHWTIFCLGFVFVVDFSLVRSVALLHRQVLDGVGCCQQLLVEMSWHGVRHVDARLCGLCVTTAATKYCSTPNTMRRMFRLFLANFAPEAICFGVTIIRMAGLVALDGRKAPKSSGSMSWLPGKSFLVLYLSIRLRLTVRIAPSANYTSNDEMTIDAKE